MASGFPVSAPVKGSPSSVAAVLSSSLPVGAPSYSSVVTRKSYIISKLSPVSLGSRPATQIYNIPAILLTYSEGEQLRKQRENTLIMKFSAGHPSLNDIRSHIHSDCNFDTPPAVGIIDQRHVTIHMGSPSDTKRALAPPANKIKYSLYRLFRWTRTSKWGGRALLRRCG